MGLSVPRPGRLPIRAYGCWETPLAFSVRHQGRELLFSRDEDEHGAWSSQYTVRERPRVAGGDARFEFPIRETGGWSLRGTAPVSGAPLRAPRARELRDPRIARAGTAERAR